MGVQQAPLPTLPKKFTIISDNKGLTSIRTMQFPKTLSKRWLDTIANYDFDVEYRKGALHQDVDYLSREGASTIDNGTEDKDESDDEGEAHITLQSMDEDTNQEYTINIKKEQETDDDIKTVKTWMIEGWEPTRDEVRRLPTSCQRYARILKVLEIKMAFL